MNVLRERTYRDKQVLCILTGKEYLQVYVSACVYVEITGYIFVIFVCAPAFPLRVDEEFMSCTVTFQLQGSRKCHVEGLA